ncbi:MAG: M14 family zinc carboxypeptidase [Planctomycetota bacterium]
MTRFVHAAALAATIAAAGSAASAGTGEAARPGSETIRIGTSADGTPIEVYAIGEVGRDSYGRRREERPALLIVAGLQAHHTLGTDVVEQLRQRLVREFDGSLDTATIYLLPLANPDGRARFLQEGPFKAESAKAPAELDADGDGRTDEDGPNDLNGDGLITMVRVAAPSAAADKYGLTATHVIDADDPRLMREPEDGEVATHAVMIEGIDDDGDGAFNEDGWGGAGGGGTNLDKNFSTHWPELTDGSGLYPYERPESRVIVDWMLSRPNITQVLVYGPHDTLGTMPKSGQYGPAKRVPKGLEKADEAHHKMASDAFKEITDVIKDGSGDRSGSMVQWAYSEFGVMSYSTPVWYRPDLYKKDGSKPGNNADEAWLAHLDDERGGEGFVNWSEVQHPQLGTVEVGGFAPGVRTNPPAGAVDGLVTQQLEFIRELTGMQPQLRVGEPSVERVGERLFRVRMTATNEGTLPTVTAIGLKTRRLAPLVVEIDADQRLADDAFLTGSRVQRADTIAGGETVSMEWLITADPGSRVRIEARSPRFGTSDITIRLEGN